MAKQQYSVKIGLGKSVKNVLITFVAPAVLYLLNGYTQWMPAETATMLAPVIGFVSYFIKNWLKNKNL